jgi:hypothetical protein
MSRTQTPRREDSQIPLFPPLTKGDEGGFLDLFASLAYLAKENFSKELSARI